jgi:hypothetical protein
MPGTARFLSTKNTAWQYRHSHITEASGGEVRADPQARHLKKSLAIKERKEYRK